MKCPHCGYAVSTTKETTIVFASPTCVGCGKEFVIFKNEAMTRYDYMTRPHTQSSSS